MDDVTKRRPPHPTLPRKRGRVGWGPMTRRGALLALSAAMVSPGAMAQQMRPVIRTRRLNNVMIAVSNLERSTAFYEKLFGPPVRQGEVIVFRVFEGPHFFPLPPTSAAPKPAFLSFVIPVPP